MRPGPLTAAVALLAVALAAWLLHATRPPPVPLPPAPPGPLAPAPAADVDTALARDLFGTGSAAPAEAEPDAPAGDVPAGDDAPPAIVGIVGRLDRDALVLVRRTGGGTRPLAVGEAAGGWRLESIAADAVLFVRDGRRVRVELPAG